MEQEIEGTVAIHVLQMDGRPFEVVMGLDSARRSEGDRFRLDVDKTDVSVPVEDRKNKPLKTPTNRP